jgi:hypothetical protein
MEVQVETVRLGKSGLPVSRLSLGTMIFGSQRDDSAAAVGLELSSDHLDRLDRVSQPFI